jgi:hypothetical protein
LIVIREQATLLFTILLRPTDFVQKLDWIVLAIGVALVWPKPGLGELILAWIEREFSQFARNKRLALLAIGAEREPDSHQQYICHSLLLSDPGESAEKECAPPWQRLRRPNRNSPNS